MNQDKLGKMGRRVQTGGSEIWARPLADGSVAVVLFSHSVSTPVTITASFQLVSRVVFLLQILPFTHPNVFMSTAHVLVDRKEIAYQIR